MKNRKRSTSFLLLIGSAMALTAAACAEDRKVDIGETLGAKLSDYADHWDGYAEAYTFDLGSDRVRLVLDANGQGTLRVGDAPIAPPASDPNVGYPVGIWRDANTRFGTTVLALFEYPVHGTKIEGGRMRLSIDASEPYAGWCALQTPVSMEDVTPVMYACVGNVGGQYDAENGKTCTQGLNGTTPVDCLKERLCLFDRTCECDATACHAAPSGGYPVQLDAALEASGGTLTGTLVVAGDRVTVRMTRR